MSKKDDLLSKLAELSGDKGRWISRAQLIQGVGWSASVSPLLNRLVAEEKVDQAPWAGDGAGGRMCSGYRPAKPRGDGPNVREALVKLDAMKGQIDEIALILRNALPSLFDNASTP